MIATAAIACIVFAQVLLGRLGTDDAPALGLALMVAALLPSWQAGLVRITASTRHGWYAGQRIQQLAFGARGRVWVRSWSRLSLAHLRAGRVEIEVDMGGQFPFVAGGPHAGWLANPRAGWFVGVAGANGVLLRERLRGTPVRMTISRDGRWLAVLQRHAPTPGTRELLIWDLERTWTRPAGQRPPTVTIDDLPSAVGAVEALHFSSRDRLWIAAPNTSRGPALHTVVRRDRAWTRGDSVGLPAAVGPLAQAGHLVARHDGQLVLAATAGTHAVGSPDGSGWQPVASPARRPIRLPGQPTRLPRVVDAACRGNDLVQLFELRWLFATPAAGGAVQELPRPEGRAPALSPDGRSLVAYDRDLLRVAAVDGSRSRAYGRWSVGLRVGWLAWVVVSLVAACAWLAARPEDELEDLEREADDPGRAEERVREQHAWSLATALVVAATLAMLAPMGAIRLGLPLDQGNRVAIGLLAATLLIAPLRWRRGARWTIIPVLFCTAGPVITLVARLP